MRSFPSLRAIVAVLNGFSQIFLQAHPGCGLLVLVAIAVYAPSLLVGALLGGVSGTLAATRLGYSLSDIRIGLYGYNAALLGMLATLLLGLSPLALALIPVLSIISSIVQQRLLRAMRERRWLPGFTLPFILLGWLSLGLIGAFESMTEARWPGLTPDVNGWAFVDGVARGIGQIIFIDEPGAGFVLLTAVLLANRRAAFWTFCGSACGIGMALLAGSEQAVTGLSGYNPALAALALSQVHRSAFAPLQGILLAAVSRHIFDLLAVPPLTMPFVLACWLMALITRVLQGKMGTPLR